MNSTIHTLNPKVKCAGLDPKSAHPLVYLAVNDRTKCPYCSVEYVLSDDSSATND